MALANTEYSFAFPAFTRHVLVQIRLNGLIRIAWASGGPGCTDYLTLFPGNWLQYSHNVESPLTLYAESPLAGQILELAHWT